MRLSIKFSLFTITLGLVLVLLITIVADRAMVKGIESMVLETNYTASQNVAAQFETYINHIEKTIKTYAKPSIFEMSDSEFERLQASLLEDVDALMLLDNKGVFNKLGVKDHSAIGRTVNDQTQFKKILDGKIALTNIIKVFNEPAFAIGTPVRSNNEIIGVLAGAVFVKRNQTLANLFREKKFGKEGYLAVIDGNGEVIFHSDSSRIMSGRNLPPDTLSLIEQGGGAKIITNRFGEKLYGALSPIKNTTWNVMVLTPVNEVSKIRYNVFDNVFMTSVILSIALIFVSILVTRIITNPLKNISDAFEKLEQKKYITLPSIKSNDELQVLTNVYNKTVEQLKNYHVVLEAQAERDGLTGIYNRRAFDKKANLLQDQTMSEKHFPLAFLMCDIDNFKSYNDSYGHLAGDDLLKKISHMINTNIVFPVYRYGGEEFALFLEKTSSEEAELIAKQIQTQIEEANLGRTISIGVGYASTFIQNIHELIEIADQALYQAKKTKNMVCKREL